MERGQLIVISAPSGTGKSTILHRLLHEDPLCQFSVSHTTRAPRPGEKDAIDYHFVDRSEFEAMIAADKFLEYADVHGNYYGTSLREVLRGQQAGKDLILDIDVAGARIVKSKMPDALFVFILPPSFAQLSARLYGRATDSESTIERRLRNACGEVQAALEYDYVLVNDDLDMCFQQLQMLIRCERLKPARNPEKIKEILESFRQSE